MNTSAATVLARVRHVVLDMDGTIYLGGNLFAETRPFLAFLAARGVGYTFITNNCSRSREEYIEHLAAMGLTATREQMWTSGLATVEHLRREMPQARRVFVLGTAGLIGEFVAGGFAVVDDAPDVVVVGFDTGLVYERLCRAAWWIRQGRPFVATHPDLTCPTPLPTVLVDCGAMCAAITAATGVRPAVVVGKPSPAMLAGLRARHGLAADELAVVGDRLMTDIAMARSAGAAAILTLTGEATRDDAARSPHTPDLIVSSLADLQSVWPTRP